MRPVSACTRLISSSWAKVVMPGLSVSTSLPCCMAAIEIAARSAGMAEVSTTAMDGIFKNGPRIADPLGLGIFGAEGGGEIVLDGVEGDELGAGILEAIHLAIDMGVIDADGGKLDIGHRSSVSYRWWRCPR